MLRDRTIRLCALLLVVPCLAAAVLDAVERRQFADGLYARGLYEPAIREYEALLTEFPDAADSDVLHFRLGESYRRAGQLLDAEKEFRTVFVEFPDSSYRARAGFKRAALFMELSQYEAAADLFRIVLESDPPAEIAAAAWYQRGEACRRLGLREEAAAAFGKVAEAYADSEFGAYALLNLGRMHRESAGGQDPESPDAQRDLDEALRLYAAVEGRAATDRVRAEALFQRAEISFRRGLFRDSAELYGRLLQDYPADIRSSEARLQAAWAAHNSGLYAEALQIADQALASGPGDSGPERQAEWLYLKANCERQLLQNEAAVASYGRLLERYPDQRFAESARYETALTYYRMGRYEEAVSVARAMPDATGELRRDLYWLLAESYASLDREEEAVQYYRLLVAEFPESPISCDASYRLAYHLQSQGEHLEASRFYHRVVQTCPENRLVPQSLFASAVCLANAGKHEEAVRDWLAVVREYPGDALVEQALYHKAMSEIRLDRNREALASLADLLAAFPGSGFGANARYWRGMLLSEAGEYADAVEEFRLALDASPENDLARSARFYLAAALQKEGREEEAAELFQELVASDMQEQFSPPLLEWLAEHWFTRGVPARALEAAELLVRRSEEPGWKAIGWNLAGRARLATDDRPGAEEAFRNALEADPGTARAAETGLSLGMLLLDAERYKEATGYLEQAAKAASADALIGVRARAYAGLGRAAVGRSDPGAAARYFMSVAILYDDAELVPECLYEAARMFGQSDQAEAARRAVAELSERYPESPWTAKAAALVAEDTAAETP